MFPVYQCCHPNVCPMCGQKTLRGYTWITNVSEKFRGYNEKAAKILDLDIKFGPHTHFGTENGGVYLKDSQLSKCWALHSVVVYLAGQ